MITLLQGISNFFETLWNIISSFFETIGYTFETISDLTGVASSFLPPALLATLIGFISVYIFIKILK